MDIAGIGGATASPFDPSQMRARREDLITAAAGALGMDRDALAGRLAAGESLGTVAESRGVDRADLTRAISAGAPGGATPPAGMIDHAIDSAGLRPPSLEAMRGLLVEGLGGGGDAAALLERLMAGEDREAIRRESGAGAEAFADLMRRGFSFDVRA